MIGRHRNVDCSSHVSDDVEVGHSGFHHDNVSALFDIKQHFEERLSAVAGILLIRTTISTTHDLYVDGVAERPVESARILCGIRQDSDVNVASVIKCRTNGRYLTHQGQIVVDAPMFIKHTAVAMVRVLVETQIRNQNDGISEFISEPSNGQLDNAIGV